MKLLKLILLAIGFSSCAETVVKNEPVCNDNCKVSCFEKKGLEETVVSLHEKEIYYKAVLDQELYTEFFLTEKNYQIELVPVDSMIVLTIRKKGNKNGPSTTIYLKADLTPQKCLTMLNDSARIYFEEYVK